MSDTNSNYKTVSHAIEAHLTTHENVMPLWSEFVGIGIGIGVAVAISLASPPKPIAIATATPIPIPTFLAFVVVRGQGPCQ